MMRTLALTKQSHRYVFRYNEGSECEVLEAVAALASDPTNDFDWVDAASLSFQITCEQASSCLKAMTPERRSA